MVDDPIKPIDALSTKALQKVNEAFNSTLLTRLNSKTEGAIVVIMQRLHEDDLVGQLDDHGSSYWRQAGEALDAKREPLQSLEQTQRSQGTLTFSAQYQQSPIPLAGNVIKREWLRYYTEPPAEFDRTIASWDTASTLSEAADYSIGNGLGREAPQPLPPGLGSRPLGVPRPAPPS